MGSRPIRWRGATFRPADKNDAIRADPACSRCHARDPLVSLDMVGELPVLRCLCTACSDAWSMDLDFAQLQRLRHSTVPNVVVQER